jgi:DNA polymerase-4
MQKTILHVDINSYFATILQQENPYLRNKPLGVIKDEGRTCLIATSKEAKEKGVGTGSRKSEALISCPELICVPATFDRYLDSTKRLQKIFKTISPSIYIYSLDEAFIDVSDCRKNLYPDVQELGRYIQDLIKTDLGDWVTSNVGVANNRLMAKMASEVAPKGSILQVTEENKDALLASTPFKDVCGIGYALAKKLELFNVNFPYQIRFLTDDELDTVFGPFWSKELRKISFGEETHLLSQLDKKVVHMKSVGRSITGYRLYEDQTEIKNILRNLCIEIISKVRAMNLAGRQVRIGLYGQQKRWSTHITLKTPINHLNQLISFVEKLYLEWSDKFPVIKFAVRLSLLKKSNQDSLLPGWQRSEKIQKALDVINRKYGIFTVHPAAIPPREELIFPEVAGFLGDREYQLRD